MLVRPDDGGIDHDVLEIWIGRQSLEKIPPNAFFRPSIEAHKHTVPMPESRRQIAPRRAGAFESDATGPRWFKIVIHGAENAKREDPGANSQMCSGCVFRI
jgi:hypothetical protein